MTCTARFAEAWEYVAFWCRKQLITGSHDSAGPGDVALTDAHADFRGRGVVPNVGMILYNMTVGTNGEVTGVTDTTITATGVTWTLADLYRIVTLRRDKIAQIELQLDTTASNIHAALGATGACDCTLAVWATQFFNKLNILETGYLNQCPCNRSIDRDSQVELLASMEAMLERIRVGEIEPCDGHTGSDWPSMAWAEQATTEFNAARILLNTALRESDD